MAKTKICTLKNWLKDAQEAIVAIRNSYIRLGKLVHIANTQFAMEERETAYETLRKLGVSDSDRRAALAAFYHQNPAQAPPGAKSIDPQLVFAGCRNNKVLGLSDKDQAKLVQGAQFDVVGPKGDVTKKSWAEMREFERNNLITKGGGIRTADEQRKLGAHSKAKAPNTRGQISTIDLVGDTLEIVMGSSAVEISVLEFVKLLGEPALLKICTSADIFTSLGKKARVA